MNEKNLKALFKSVGLPETLITELAKDDFDPKEAVASFHTAQKEHYTEIVKNEITETIKEETIRATEGKIYNTLNNDLKKIGVPLEKIKDLPVHEKLKIAKQ